MTQAAKVIEHVALAPTSMPVPQVSETSALIHMIERVARDPQANVANVRELIAMRREMLADEAKRAFDAAFPAMQADLPVIIERGEIKIAGNNKPGQKYALWEDINEQIKPVLEKHGFGLSFRTGQTDNKIVVTGILKHEGGHREETTMHLPVDTSGSKNAVQAVGSSTSYGKRYTASALLNLTSRGEDDDGRAAGAGDMITDEQAMTIRDLINDDKAIEARVLKWLKAESINAIPASMFDQVVANLKKVAQR